MAPSREHGRSRTTLVVLVLISITVIALDAGGFGPLNGLKSGFGTVFSPVRSVGDAVFGPVGDAFNGIFNRSDLEAENAELRERIDRLLGDRAAAETAAAELDQIRATLDLPSYGDIVSTHAQVITGPASNFDRTVRINKGANAGIRPGMPVVTEAGLVGRVVDVSLNESSVRLVTEPGHPIGVKHVTSGDVGVAEGGGEGAPLRVGVGLDAQTEINPGDLFSTSGEASSVYPPGIPVGVAMAGEGVTRPSGGDTSADSTTTTTTAAVEPAPEQTISLRPASDLDHLSFVSVMLWTAN